MNMTKMFERARALHQANPVVECHTDIAFDVFRRRRAGELLPYRDDYLRRLRVGGVRIQFLAVGGDLVRPDCGKHDPETFAHALIADARAEALRVVETGTDLDVPPGDTGFVLHFEGAAPLLGESPLEAWYALGVRSVQLTWNGRNAAADGVGVEPSRGLTEVGRELVAACDELGVTIDVSHLAEPGFWDVIDLAGHPIIASHANAAAICPHRRNLSDDQIRAVAASGGIIGVCFVAEFIGRDASLERLLDHVDHIAALVGVDALAIGPDYVAFAPDLLIPQGARYLGPEGLQRVETLPVFTAGLLRRGYAEEDAVKIIGGNALRVLRAVLTS